MLRRLAAVALLLAACGQPDTAAESLPLLTLTPEAPAPPTTAPPATVLVVDPSRLTVAPEVWGGYDRGLFPTGSTSTGTAATPAKRC